MTAPVLSVRDRTDGDDGFTVGGDGALFDLDGDRWHLDATSAGANLTAVARRPVDVAVGAGGTAFERR